MTAVPEGTGSGVGGSDPDEVGVPLTAPPPQPATSKATTVTARRHSFLFILRRILGAFGLPGFEHEQAFLVLFHHLRRPEQRVVFHRLP